MTFPISALVLRRFCRTTIFATLDKRGILSFLFKPLRKSSRGLALVLWSASLFASSDSPFSTLYLVTRNIKSPHFAKIELIPLTKAKTNFSNMDILTHVPQPCRQAWLIRSTQCPCIHYHWLHSMLARLHLQNNTTHYYDNCCLLLFWSDISGMGMS